MEELRTRSRWLARAVLVVLLVLVAVPIIIAIALFAGDYPHPDMLVRQLPLLFYAWALWSIREWLSNHAAGGSLTTGAGRSIQGVGISLFFGGLSNVFGVPLILRAMRGHGSFAYFDISAITVGAVGLSLIVIGRLLTDAEAARRELDEFV